MHIRSVCCIAIIFNAFLVACSSKDKVQILLEKTVADINKERFVEVESTLRIDSCEALPNRTIKYHYTLLFSSSSTDSLEFKNDTKKTLLYNIKTNPSYNYLRDNGVTFIYSYKDQQGNNWGEIIITKEDYNSPIAQSELRPRNDKTRREIVEDAFNEVAKQLPLDFDHLGLTVTACKVVSDSMLEYTYRLNEVSYLGFDSIQYKRGIYTQIEEGLVADPKAIAMMSKGIYFKYIYVDQKNEYLCSIVVSPENISEN